MGTIHFSFCYYIIAVLLILSDFFNLHAKYDNAANASQNDT